MPLDTEERRQYQKKYRQRKGGQKSYHKRWAGKNPEKVKEHNRVNSDVKQGAKKRPQSCSRCGSKEGTMQAHHVSYSQGKTVWLCARCHAKTKPNTGPATSK